MMKRFNKLLIIITTIFSFIILFATRNIKIYKILLCISILPVMLLPYLIDKYTKFKIPVYFRTAYIIFIFFSYFLGSIMEFYDKIFLYDKIIHAISGIFTGILAYINLKNDKKLKLSKLNKLIYIIAFSMFIATLWEFFEYGSDLIFKGDAQKVLNTGINDTMQDMLVALFGCILYITFNRKKINEL